MKKKLCGKWTEIHEKLLPDHVLITSDQIRELYLELKRVLMAIKLLGKDGKYFTMLSDQETEWLKRIMDFR